MFYALAVCVLIRATSHGSSSAHGSGGMAVQYQVTHEMVAEPVPSLSWGLPNASDSHATRTSMTRVISLQPQCPALVLGGQAQWQGAQPHSVPEHEITFNRDSSHMGGSSSPPSPSFGPSLPLLGCSTLQIPQ